MSSVVAPAFFNPQHEAIGTLSTMPFRDCRPAIPCAACKKEESMLIVIGGDAAGMSAASQVRRLQPETDITVFERGRHTSYSA